MKLIDFLPDFKFEKRHWGEKDGSVAGADEVGRGALAGPVVAACVVYKTNFVNSKAYKELDLIINDSKKLTLRQRLKADSWIRKNSLAFGIGTSKVSRINNLGIKKASEGAFRSAISICNRKLTVMGLRPIKHLLVDAFFIPYVSGVPVGKKLNSKRSVVKRGVGQTAIVKGDQKSFSIASASIIAKVYRDELMEKLSRKKTYKKYEWDKNKGYGTKKHIASIGKYGLTRFHRKTFVNTALGRKA